MIFVTVLVLALAMFISYEVIRTYVRTDEVVVPNIKGMKVLDAMKLLSGDGKKELGLIQERAEASGFVAPGEVIEQKPAAGTTVKKGSPVRVTVSSGRARLQVPEVVRESKDNATNKIKGAGLEVGDMIYVENEQVPKDHVISQSPDGGKGLDESTRVDLMVSKGPRGNSLTMPDVTGISPADARDRLSKAGITDIVVEPPGVDGVVREQQPLVGKIVQQTQRVVLRVGAPAAPGEAVAGPTPIVTVR
jgi:eukaryotic-like serine/threonine-protein kinase